MKKILILVGILSSYFCTYGALQYQLVSTPDPLYSHIRVFNFITVQILEGGSLWVSPSTIDYSVLKDYEWGWKDINSGEIHTASGENKLFRQPGVGSKEGILLGDFSAGDEISLWVTNDSGIMANGWISIPEQQSADGIERRYISPSNSDLWGNPFVIYGLSTQDTIGFSLLADEYQFPAASSGQPLPGTLTALLLGGGSLAFRRLKKRKKNRNI